MLLLKHHTCAPTVHSLHRRVVHPTALLVVVLLVVVLLGGCGPRVHLLLLAVVEAGCGSTPPHQHHRGCQAVECGVVVVQLRRGLQRPPQGRPRTTQPRRELPLAPTAPAALPAAGGQRQPSSSKKPTISSSSHNSSGRGWVLRGVGAEHSMEASAPTIAMGGRNRGGPQLGERLST